MCGLGGAFEALLGRGIDPQLWPVVLHRSHVLAMHYNDVSSGLMRGSGVRRNPPKRLSLAPKSIADRYLRRLVFSQTFRPDGSVSTSGASRLGAL